MKIYIPNYALYLCPFFASSKDIIFQELKNRLDNLKDDSFDKENTVTFELYKLSDLKSIFKHITNAFNEVNLLKEERFNSYSDHKNIVIQFYDEILFNKFKLMLCLIVSIETLSDKLSKQLFKLNNIRLKKNDFNEERSSDLEIMIKNRYLNNVKLFLFLSKVSHANYVVFEDEKINKKFKEFGPTLHQEYLFIRSMKNRKFWKSDYKNEEIIYDYLINKEMLKPSYEVIESALKENKTIEYFQKIFKILKMEQEYWFDSIENILKNSGKYSKDIENINQWIDSELSILTIEKNSIVVESLENISHFYDLDILSQNKIKLNLNENTKEQKSLTIDNETRKVLLEGKTQYVFNEEEKNSFLNTLMLNIESIQKQN